MYSASEEHEAYRKLHQMSLESNQKGINMIATGQMQLLQNTINTYKQFHRVLGLDYYLLYYALILGYILTQLNLSLKKIYSYFTCKGPCRTLCDVPVSGESRERIITAPPTFLVEVQK